MAAETVAMDDYDSDGDSNSDSEAGSGEDSDFYIQEGDQDTSLSSSSSEKEEAEAVQTFLSKSRNVEWSSVAYGQRVNRVADTPTLRPGPTEFAVAKACDISSTFNMFITPPVELIILQMTNLEGIRKRGDSWKGMDKTDLRAYIGLLILAGVYRSRGEAAESLWNAERGRVVFKATMALKLFHTYSTLLRFDDRETRPVRRATDKMAAIRTVWDIWVDRLPILYNPGPNITVDEQLVRFRGMCPFRQYMPSKPAKYGIKAWVACDARTSYAWKLQVYTGKSTAGSSEKNQGRRVVLEMTQGLKGPRTVTCDNFFTSYDLGQELLKRDITLVGTIRKNKVELPAALLDTRARPVLSSKFAFTPDPLLVSYLPKKNKNVLVLSTLHTEASVSDHRDRKPAVILDYNKNKGGVDTLDKAIGTYSCRRKRARWPLAVFHNIIDVSAYNAFVIWRELNPEWCSGKLHKRRLFLEGLCKELVRPLMERRRVMPRAAPAEAVVRAVQRGAAPRGPPEAADAAEAVGGPVAEPAKAQHSKRKRCCFCPPKKDSKTHTVCCVCNKYVCKTCTNVLCPACADRRLW